MQRTEIICDICGTRKGETNHWWLVGYTNVGFHIYPTDFAQSDLGNQMDLCSESCVSKALSQFMSRIKTAQDEQRKQIISEELERDPTLKDMILVCDICQATGGPGQSYVPCKLPNQKHQWRRV